MPTRVVFEQLTCQNCGMNKVYSVRIDDTGWAEVRLNIDRSDCTCGYKEDEAALCREVATGD